VKNTFTFFFIPQSLKLTTIQDDFTIYQFSKGEPIPSQIPESEFYSITKTTDGILIIANCNYTSDKISVNSGWKGFKID
jgi:hypothetical protein